MKASTCKKAARSQTPRQIPCAATASLKSSAITTPRDCTIAGRLTSPMAWDDAKLALFAPFSCTTVGHRRRVYLLTSLAEPKRAGHCSFGGTAPVSPSHLFQATACIPELRGAGVFMGFPKWEGRDNFFAQDASQFSARGVTSANGRDSRARLASNRTTHLPKPGPPFLSHLPDRPSPAIQDGKPNPGWPRHLRGCGI